MVWLDGGRERDASGGWKNKKADEQPLVQGSDVTRVRMCLPALGLGSVANKGCVSSARYGARTASVPIVESSR